MKLKMATYETSVHAQLSQYSDHMRRNTRMSLLRNVQTARGTQFPIQWMQAVIYVGSKGSVKMTRGAEAINSL